MASQESDTPSSERSSCDQIRRIAERGAHALCSYVSEPFHGVKAATAYDGYFCF
jgi:hypothetical protein